MYGSKEKGARKYNPKEKRSILIDKRSRYPCANHMQRYPVLTFRGRFIFIEEPVRGEEHLYMLLLKWQTHFPAEKKSWRGGWSVTFDFRRASMMGRFGILFGVLRLAQFWCYPFRFWMARLKLQLLSPVFGCYISRHKRLLRWLLFYPLGLGSWQPIRSKT